MRLHILIFFVSITMVCLSCRQSPEQKLAALEAKARQHPLMGNDLLKLAGLYIATAEQAKTQDLACERYTKAGSVLWRQAKLPAEAAKPLMSALRIQDVQARKGQAAGLLLEAYKALREKPGVETPDTEFSAQIRDLLLNNRNWLDSALQYSRNSMVDANQQLVNPDAALELTDRIEGYVLALGSTNDQRKAELQFEAANANRAIGNFARAISFYNLVAQNSADLQKAANSQFMIAFVFENDMNRLEQAREAYQVFLKKYPKSEMADDAKIALANLGKTPEQLLESLLKR